VAGYPAEQSGKLLLLPLYSDPRTGLRFSDGLAIFMHTISMGDVCYCFNKVMLGYKPNSVTPRA
jgi:hypothetical protein